MLTLSWQHVNLELKAKFGDGKTIQLQIVEPMLTIYSEV